MKGILKRTKNKPHKPTHKIKHRRDQILEETEDGLEGGEDGFEEAGEDFEDGGDEIREAVEYSGHGYGCLRW